MKTSIGCTFEKDSKNRQHIKWVEHIAFAVISKINLFYFSTNR